MAEKYIMGIDGGSQSTKVIIFDLQGNIVCEANKKLRPMYTPVPGVAEHPDDDLFESIVIAMERVLAKFTGDVNDILAIGLCTIRCCRCLVKKDGTLASQAISWMDNRLARPYEHENDEVAYVTTTSGYIMSRLTGNFTDTTANYIGPWPMDVRNWKWFVDPAKFDSYETKKEMLYDLQMPGEIGGHVNEFFSKLTGLPVGIPVVHTANDKAVEALGTGLNNDHTGLVSLGTYITSMVSGDKYVGEANTYFTNFASVPNNYIFESWGIRRGMWTVTWVKNFVGQEIINKAKENNQSWEEYLNTQASKLTPGSDGLVCILDWLAPPNALHKKGMFLGFDERHTYVHMYRSVIEGIVLTMKENFQTMTTELEKDIDTLVISGGGSNSDLVMQTFADAFGIKTVRNVINGAAGLGAAICAAVAVDVYDSFDEAIDKMVKVKDTFTPNMKNHEIYQKLSVAYNRIPNATDPILKEIYDILEEEF